MANNIILSIVIISELMIGSYFLGRYISKYNEIFDNNPFAAWTLGFITNFFLTFTAFFIFTWIDTPIIYYVIMYFVKEFFMFAFLIMKREKFISFRDLRNVIIILVASISIVFIYNYGIVRYTNDVQAQSVSDFNSWFQFKLALSHFSKIPDWIINKWVLSFISSSIAFSAVTAFIVEISRGYTKYDVALGYLITLGIICVAGIGVRIEDTAGYFLLLFMLLIAIRLVIYSRRRYAAQFGITSFVAWTIDSHVFVAATTLALVTTIIYTFLRKPRASLFWVQLISPQIILMSLELHWISNAIVIPLFILSAGLYIFMLSVSRIKLLGKLNSFVVKHRILIPVVMLTIIVSSTIAVIATKDISIGWMDMKTTSSIIYNNTDGSRLSSIIQMVVWGFLFFMVIFRLVMTMKHNKNIHWKEYIYIFIVLMALFVYNPFIERMFESTTALSNQISRMGIIVTIPVIILLLKDVNKYAQLKFAK